MPVSIVVVDNHAIVRQGLVSLLNMQTGFKVLGQAANGLEALNLVEELKPNIVVLDLSMPGIGGLEVTWQISHKYKYMHVIILSTHNSVPYAAEAFRNGAKAYIVKDADTDHVVRAIREVMENRTYLSPPLTQEAINEYRRKTRTGALEAYEILTKRERMVFNLAAEGLNNPEIARRLEISVRTAETHRSNILRKLNVANQAELVRYAIEHHLLIPEA